MNTDFMYGLGGVWLIIVVIYVVLTILWLLIPFAIFGVKPILRDISRESTRTNILLEQIKKRTEEINTK